MRTHARPLRSRTLTAARLACALASLAPARVFAAEEDLGLPPMPSDPGPLPEVRAHEGPLGSADDLRESNPLEQRPFATTPEGVHIRGSATLFGVTEPASSALLGGGFAGTVGLQFTERLGLELGARGAYGARPQVGGSVLFDVALIPAIAIAVGPTLLTPLREGEYSVYGSVRTQLRLDRVGQRAAMRRASLILDVWLEPGMNYGVQPSASMSAIASAPSAYFAFSGGLGLGVGWF